jgi:acylphosphatase
VSAVRVLVKGRVQGVGFRDFVENEAVSRGLSGWVRNRRSGEVEMVLSGLPHAIDGMIAACRRGPRLASVTAIESESIVDQAWPGFAVLPTA